MLRLATSVKEFLPRYPLARAVCSLNAFYQANKQFYL